MFLCCVAITRPMWISHNQSQGQTRIKLKIEGHNFLPITKLHEGSKLTFWLIGILWPIINLVSDKPGPNTTGLLETLFIYIFSRLAQASVQALYNLSSSPVVLGPGVLGAMCTYKDISYIMIMTVQLLGWVGLWSWRKSPSLLGFDFWLRTWAW